MLLGLRITEQLQNYERTNNVQLKSTSLYTLYVGVKTTGTFHKKQGIYTWREYYLTLPTILPHIP